MRALTLTSLIIAAGTASTALASPQPQPMPMPDQSVVAPADFEVMLVASDQGVNPGERVADYEWHGANIDPNGAVLLESCWAGNYPFAGVHLTFEPGFWEAHLDQLRRHVERFVPDPEYTGLIVVDYEHWRPVWDRTRNEPGSADPSARDYDFKDDWREFARVRYADQLQGLNAAQKEEVFRQTYEAAAREFFVRTVREIKRTRPNAKAGYFMIPVRRYGSQETPQGVIGYGNLTYTASQLNDRLPWVAEECDFLMPNVYGTRLGVPNGEPYDIYSGEAPAWRNAEYIYSSVAEAVRMARGKPVYVIGSTKYWTHTPDPDPNMPMTELDMEQQFEYSRLAGASGLVLWHYKPDIPDNVFQPYIESTLGPIAAGYNIHDNVDVNDDLDDNGPTLPSAGAGDAPQSGSGDEDEIADGSPGEKDPTDSLTPEEQAHKDSESGKDEDSGFGSGVVVTSRYSGGSSLLIGGAKPSGSASGESKRRVYRKNANKKKDESSKPGAPTEDKTTTSDKKDKKVEKGETERPTRRWVYTSTPSNRYGNDD